MKHQLQRAWRLAILLLPVLLLSFVRAEASHFRYGSLSWSKTATNGTVKFSFKAAFRRTSYSGTGTDSRPIVGDIITETTGATALNFGDNTNTGTLRFVVTSYSVAEDWILGEALEPNTNNAGIPHAYAGNGPYVAAVAGSARVATLNNGANGGYRMETSVTPFGTNSSPVTSQPPIVTLPASTSASFTVVGSDPNGDNLRYRLATSTESGVPAPAGLTINANTGVVTWNTSTLNQANLWTVQVMIEDLDGNGNVKTKTPIDFLMKIVPVVGVAPSVAINQSSPISVCNSSVNFTVTATDPDAGATVTLAAAGMPAGASMSPSLPATGSTGLSSNFSWTPTASQTGSFVVNFTVTDNTGQQTQQSMIINVSSPTATVANKTICVGQSTTLTAATNANNPTYLWSPGGANTQSITVSPGSTTIYTVTVSDGALACSTSATGTVTVNQLPNVVATSNSPVNQGGTITASATGATNYTWSGPNNYIAAGSGFSINNAQAINAGVYTVEGTDGNNCKNTASTTVLVAPAATALNFDGVDDYVNINNTLGNFGTGDFTVEMNVRTTQTSNFYLIGKRAICDASNFWNIGVGGGKPGMEINNGVSGGSLNSTIAINNGQWHHLAITRKGTTMSIYIDGALNITGTVSLFNLTNTSVLQLGSNVCNNQNPSLKYIGDMDEVRIWNRALCAAEISNNKNCELPAGQTGLLAYYKFNQGFVGVANTGVSTLVDETGNNNGTLQNFALNGTTSNWMTGNVSGACAAYTVPVATITPAGSTTVCGGSVVLNASTGTGYTYQWKLNGNNIANANAATYTATISGNYTVEVSTTNCPVLSSAVSVTINPVPTIAASNNGPVGQGSAVTLTASGNATSYSWSGPNNYSASGTSATITNAQSVNAGIYTLIGTNAQGCKDTVVTTVEVSTIPAGALNFDGSNDRVVLQPTIANLQNFTVEAWVKWNGVNYATIYAEGLTSSLNPMFSLTMRSNGYELVLRNGAAVGLVANPTSSPVAPNQWAHVAFVRTSATTGQLFVNGVKTEDFTFADPGFIQTNVATLGVRQRSQFDGFLNGSLDEVRIWDRALCQGEIQNNMNCQLGGGQAGLISYYQFNQGFLNANNNAVNTLLDASGHNNNGTLNSMALNGATSNWVAGNIGGSCATFAPPVAVITPAGPTTVCDATVVLNGQTGTGYNYQWKLNGNDIPNANSASYTATTSGSYTLEVNANGCIDKSAAVNVTINAAPVFAACPSNIEVATTSTTCNAVVNYTTSVTGTPAPAVTYTLSGATAGSGAGNGSGLTFNKGVTTVAVTAANSCGTAQCSFTVTVNDNVNPVVVTKNITAYLNASGVATIAAADVNNGSSDNCGTVSLSLIGTTTTTGTICATGVEHGNSAVLTAPAGAVISAINFASYGLPNGSCGNFTTSSCHSASSMSVVSNLAIGQNSVTIPASNDLFGDPCFGAGKRLYIQATYQMTTPANVPLLSFNCGMVGSNTVTLVGKDATGNTSSATAIVTVLDTIKPVLNIPANITVNCNGSSGPAATGNASATDICGATVSFTDASTQSANINSAAHYNYVISRTWTAKDASNNTVSAVQTITVQDVTKPTINCPSAITIACDGDSSISTTGTATANDNCGPVMITRSDVSTQSANVNDVAHYNYTITRTWVAKDVTGNSNSCTQVISVEDAAAPTVTNCPSTVTVNCQDDTTPESLGAMTADDNCSPVTITHSDVSTQDANVNNAGHYNYVITRTWTATDVTGNSNGCTQTITVQDVTKPGITVPASVTLNCQDDNSTTANGTATGIDNCSPVAITYSDASTQNTNVNNAGHYNYVITRTWTATDVTGNSTSADQTITVQDVTKPGITVPANVTLNCQDDNSTSANGTATGTDNCSPVAITYSDASTQNANVNNAGHYNYVITRTWTATDVTGNATSANQVITVQDVTKPSITCPANKTVSCKTSVADNGTATGSDNCSPVAITSSDVSTQNSNPANSGYYNYTITRTWKATDVSGNFTTCDQVITVHALNNAAVAVSPVNTINANHQIHTIYLGYGPQSVSLSSTVQDGVGPRSYSWTPITGSVTPASATTSVSPLVSTTYTVTITDGTGCSITQSMPVQVIDVRCGNKVKICHYPPGNPANTQQQCLPTSAIAAHLAHGCVLGDCPSNKNSGTGDGEEGDNHGVEAMVTTDVKVYPNPNTGAFTVELPAGLEKSEVVITDMAGKVIQKQTALEGNKLQFDLGPVARGMYMLHLTNGSQNFRTRISVQ
ncbi:LamG-like jellyroll fold domain-containing protein [Polluticoccus soli]|uniref:LamG-like jellyroll fold domain-containing protein n=1 Tax=Polluticoccus soli TaxID=3034150 RepID=UPI0023E2DC92|nr:LamG-like jellyroll fold domain-containing protein [Flavipsychrobacter sp. JY13-12]